MHATSHDKDVAIPEIASDRQIDAIVTAIDQLARITRPKFYGIENAAADRALFVGNHTFYGVTDVPFLVAELWRVHGHKIRSLGDHRHWVFPGWREFLENFGAVRGTRAATAELMRRGEPILVYPGGGREVNKRRGEKYQLIWKNRVGFARLAIAHDYTIVPFATVGGEDVFEVLLDANTPIYGDAARLVERMTESWTLPSIARGIGPTLLPRPQRMYYWFGEPIETGAYKQDGDAGVRRLRDHVKREVEGGIEFLLAEREADPARSLLPRLLGRGL